MKKTLFVTLVVALAFGMAVAQNEPVTGNLAYTPTTDVFGAHENGGRGCAGCHAPHSGGRGAGWASSSATGAMGDTGLWGTDPSKIEAAGTITFDGSYPVALTGLSWGSTAPGSSIFTGIVTCLSCHDGNYSKGAMMSGVSYEQAFGLLNFATNAGSNHQSAPVNLYGSSNLIPTLLGNDGGVVGDYSNDHPVGPAANIGHVLGNAATLASYGINLSVSTATSSSAPLGKNSLVIGSFTGQYANFVSGYGYWALNGMVSNNDQVVSNFFVTCTTCHNQHNMNVVSSTVGHAPLQIANGQVVSAAKIFFVNGPYNPGAPYDPTHVPSTMRFCQQCHFSMASEAYGSGTTVGTAF